MIPTSDEYKVLTQQPHEATSRVDVYFNDVYVRSLDVHDGSVDADRNAAVVRRFDCKVSDPDGTLTPQGIRDLLAPFGTVLKIYRGINIPTVTKVRQTFDTTGEWNAGTRDDTIGYNGVLMLGNT